MEVATYKPVQGCQLRMTPATAIVFHLCMQLCSEQPISKEEHGGAYDLQAARLSQDAMPVRPKDLIDNCQI
jgi:hypothetical protein